MKKWFAILLALCVLMGSAIVTAESVYEIQNNTLYVYGTLDSLPDGEYDSIRVEDNATLSLTGEVWQDVTNYQNINGGTFKGTVNNYKNINGGTFYGTVTNYQNINGGTFFGPVNCCNGGGIHDGTFHGVVDQENSKIYGGVFTASSEVHNARKSKITGGTFSGTVFNGNFGSYGGGQEGFIRGGTFTETSELNNGRKGIISGGTFNGKVYYFIFVKIDEPQNGGTVVVSADSTNEKKAMVGETVRLTVVPENGYELDSLIVTDPDENAVALSKTADSDYQFTMPASIVRVTASFKECTTVPDLPPQTGDSSSPLLWLAMSLLSMAGILLLRKKAYSR